MRLETQNFCCIGDVVVYAAIFYFTDCCVYKYHKGQHLITLCDLKNAILSLYFLFICIL